MKQRHIKSKINKVKDQRGSEILSCPGPALEQYLFLNVQAALCLLHCNDAHQKGLQASRLGKQSPALKSIRTCRIYILILSYENPSCCSFQPVYSIYIHCQDIDTPPFFIPCAKVIVLLTTQAYFLILNSNTAETVQNPLSSCFHPSKLGTGPR